LNRFQKTLSFAKTVAQHNFIIKLFCNFTTSFSEKIYNLFSGKKNILGENDFITYSFLVK